MCKELDAMEAAKILVKNNLMQKPKGKGFQCTKRVRDDLVHVYVLLPGIIEKGEAED